jgi:two-component system OmpR family sensor kinase
MGRLTWKFFAFIWLAQMAGILGIAGAFWLHHQAGEAERALDFSTPAGLMVGAAQATLTHGGRQALQQFLGEMRGDRFAVFAVDDAGHEVLGRAVPAHLLATARADAAASGPVRQVRASDGAALLLFVPETRAARARGLNGGRSRGPHAGPLPVVPMLAAMLGSLISAALLARYVARPMRQLRQAFDEVARGNLDPQLEQRMGHGQDELSRLGRDFDRMSARLQTLMEGERRLLHDVSHELRSPLARMQAAIALARQQPARAADMLERIDRDSGRMDVLIGELLTLSRLQSQTMAAPDGEVQMDELLAGIIDDANFEASLSGRTVSHHCEPMTTVRGSGELLHRAIENLVRNAIRHTAPDTEIDITAGMTPDHRVRIAVCDRGPGVPEAELEAIFQPFHRGAGVTSGDGHGLGLAIARRVVESHGGSIRAMNREGGGLCVEMLLPAQRGLM